MVWRGSRCQPAIETRVYAAIPWPIPFFIFAFSFFPHKASPPSVEPSPEPSHLRSHSAGAAVGKEVGDQDSFERHTYSSPSGSSLPLDWALRVSQIRLASYLDHFLISKRGLLLCTQLDSTRCFPILFDRPPPYESLDSQPADTCYLSMSCVTNAACQRRTSFSIISGIMNDGKIRSRSTLLQHRLPLPAGIITRRISVDCSI